eukprot:2651396-Heterocapsa_arctica.AAC.1
MAIPPCLWQDDMWRDREPAGDYITRSAAAYSSDFNHILAIMLIMGASQARESEASHSLVRS